MLHDQTTLNSHALAHGNLTRCLNGCRPQYKKKMYVAKYHRENSKLQMLTKKFQWQVYVDTCTLTSTSSVEPITIVNSLLQVDMITYVHIIESRSILLLYFPHAIHVYEIYTSP